MDLQELRAEIDRIDGEIVKLLKKRNDVAVQIGAEKKIAGTDIEDIDRDRRVIENYKKLGDGELDEEFLEELVAIILKYSKEVQRG